MACRAIAEKNQGFHEQVDGEQDCCEVVNGEYGAVVWLIPILFKSNYKSRYL
jgi:hypothetical protein